MTKAQAIEILKTDLIPLVSQPDWTDALLVALEALIREDEQEKSNDSEEDDNSDYDHCYECTGYGDDYHIDENGELVSSCTDCPYNESR